MRFHESDTVSPGQLDFVPRERKNQILVTVFAFTLSMALIFVVGYASGANYRIYAPLFSMLIVGALCFFVVYGKQQSNDLIMSTEYQNMLFAQAISLGSSFCMFVRRDGTIVYANDGLRQVFFNFAYSDSQALDGLFERSGVPKIDRERIVGAIHSNKTDRLVFPIAAEDGTVRDYVLTVEPLARPSGYVVIRGREFLGQRAGVQLLPDVLRSTSAEKLDHLLTHTPIAHYVTNNFGELEYANPALEQLLGYSPGEVLETKKNIRAILHQINGDALDADYTVSEMHGQAVLTRKTGSHVTGLLHQQILRDGNGKAIGATATILPVAAA